MTIPRRPASLYTQVAAPGSPEETPGRRGELADDLVEALLSVGANDPDAALARADELGLATMAQVWSDAEPATRAGLMWTLHLLRAWCAFRPADGTRLFRDGRALAPVGEVVAGLPWAAGETDVTRLGELLLLTAYAGRLDSAAERAAGFISVIGAGVVEGEQPRRQRLAELQRRLELAAAAARDGGLG